MSRWQYTKGLHELGNSIYAYLQPDGSLGWSNAGLITDGGLATRRYTLFDLTLTLDMLETMRRAAPAASHIDMVVNTHANGDHCYGNQLVADTHIIASQKTADEMVKDLQAAQLAAILRQAPHLGQAGRFLLHAFGSFDFENITLTPPNQTFEGEMVIRVGNKTVQLIEVGPAHTRGDTALRHEKSYPQVRFSRCFSSFTFLCVVSPP